jgi:regulator of RNase E activity RraA
MTDDTVSIDELAALAELDTPSVCNAIELVEPERRGYGFTTRMLHCVRPELGAMVGIARTVTVRTTRPAPLAPEAVARQRFAYLDYVADAEAPTISVAQDLDEDELGFGAFWGEVNSAMHKALGCVGSVGNAGVRDIDMLAEGFQILAGSVAPSHAFVHIVEHGGTVNVAGMVVRSGDLIHADRHGAVVVPRGKAGAVIEAAGLMSRREAVVLEATRAPGADAESIKAAMIAMTKVA